ncbi:MAG: radical SAM protein [Elusimicrobia bacterium]|nr:radical SAM protein [Elusimicrobiota bacterium]
MSAERPLSFNWDINWVCDYGCPYCWFHGKWEELRPRSPALPVERILRAWERTHARYGPAKVSITGGEPLLYPGFTEIVAGISRRHAVEVISNLSRDVSGLVASCRGREVTVNPSFHPLRADAEVFIPRALALKEAGMLKAVTVVAWPPLVARLAELQALFRGKGLSLTVQPFQGEHDGRRYPEAYTPEQRRGIEPDLGSRGGETFRMGAMTTRGRLCHAGRRYAVIHPDGTAQRCGGAAGEDRVLGNFFSDGFSLLESPRPCASDSCPCNEWAFLLDT